MSDAITKSLSLLRAVLWKNARNVYNNSSVTIGHPITVDDWKAVGEFFTRQSLDGLLPDAIASLPVDRQPAMAIKMPMIMRQLQVERMNRAMNSELLEFTGELERRHIPYALLKGQGVASLYPNMLHRVCGDIDLYVPAKYLKEVHRGLMAFGAVRETESRHHINYRANGVEWELHHKI